MKQSYSLKKILAILILNLIYFCFFHNEVNCQELYIKIGNDLNREETSFANYPERSQFLIQILREFKSDERLNPSSRMMQFCTRADHFLNFNSGSGLLVNKDKEFFAFFDLILFNAINFKSKIQKGSDINNFVTEMQPRITDSFYSNLRTKTNKENVIMRRGFISVFSGSNLVNSLTATEKLRLKSFIQAKTDDSPRFKPREMFNNTDLILGLLKPYLTFNENFLINDLFDFNKDEVQKSPEKVKIPEEKISKKFKPEKKEQDIRAISKKTDDFTGNISNFLKDPKKTLWLLSVAGVLLFMLVVLVILSLRKAESFYKTKTSKSKVENMDKKDSTKTPFEEFAKPLNDDSLHEAATKFDAVSQIMISSLPPRYEKIWKISKGGMGVIFGGHDKFLRRKVAIKMISPSLCDDKKIVQRFVNEARSVASLDHPNILKIFDVGGEDYPFFVMEYLEGISLEDLINRKGKLSSEEIKFYALQMAEAFKYCHERDIIHRDIKPANILIVNNFRQVKVVDFGIAKDPSHSEGLTQTNASIGSPQYMSPEQIKENKYGVSSDIYSYGMTLYKMATGIIPFGDDITSRLTKQPPHIKEIAPPELNKLLASLIMKCISLDITSRFNDFGQIRTVLIKMKL